MLIVTMRRMWQTARHHGCSKVPSTLQPSGMPCMKHGTLPRLHITSCWVEWFQQAHHLSTQRRISRRLTAHAIPSSAQEEANITNATTIDGHSSQSSHINTASQSRKGGKSKRRLDAACLELHPNLSRNIVQSWIVQRKVFVDGKIVDKPGAQVTQDADIVITAAEQKYVCRAGFKLEKALQHFSIDVSGLVCLDSGQSTGGFTDCLLQNGAEHVYGIDVGYGQVADKIRRDERVTVIERFNLRHLKPEDIPTQVDLATLDLAFISVLKVIPAVTRVLRPAPSGQLLVLIKPQFEAGRGQVSHKGLVKDPKIHQEVIERVTKGIEEWGFICQGVCESPIKGDKSGNTEFLAHFTRDPTRNVTSQSLEAAAAVAAADDEGTALDDVEP